MASSSGVGAQMTTSGAAAVESVEPQALMRDEQATAGASSVEAPAAGFAKRKNRGHIRKRPADEVDGTAATAADGELADGAAPAVARRSKAAKEAPLAFTTRREGGGDAGAGPRLEAFKYESARTLQQASDMGATRGNQQETAFDRDARRARPPATCLACARALEAACFAGAGRCLGCARGWRPPPALVLGQAVHAPASRLREVWEQLRSQAVGAPASRLRELTLRRRPARRARREAVLSQAVEGAVADGVYTGMNNYIDYTAVRTAGVSASLRSWV